MTLADDLRATAVDHAAIAITQALAGTGGADPERLARAAVQVAAAFLLDAHLVQEALDAREPIDVRSRRPRPTPTTLWQQAARDEDRYLTLMQEHGWLTLTTARADGGPVSR